MQNSEKRKEGMTPCSANFGNNEHCAGSVNVVDGKGTLDQPLWLLVLVLGSVHEAGVLKCYGYKVARHILLRW